MSEKDKILEGIAKLKEAQDELMAKLAAMEEKPEEKEEVVAEPEPEPEPEPVAEPEPVEEEKPYDKYADPNQKLIGA